MRNYFPLIGILITAIANGQTTVKYYDADWQESRMEKATYYAEFTKVATGYKCLSYWKSSKKKREESFYADTSMTRPNGLQKVFHKNGALEDSILYNADGKIGQAFHFYPNKKLECHYVTDAVNNGVVQEAYDEFGEKIKNYVYVRSALPKGGLKAWQSFILKNTSKDLIAEGDKPQTVKLVLSFAIDEYGYVSKPRIIESSGIKAVDQDALRVMQLSPQWQPAIYKNKPFRYPVTQPLQYDLQPAKK